ncbi:MAG: hypothetical protein ACI8TQ_002530 [Planctomycetota bacterium]|jgi:hypothetical protein
MPVEEYLTQLFRHSHTEATGARIHSQFEENLREGDPTVGVLGLYCCEQFAGGITYGHRPLPHRPEFYSARLDTVLTVGKYREVGLGSVLMAGLFNHSVLTLGDRLRHYSTIAMHPNVGHYVSRFGFTSLAHGDTPLYSLCLEDAEARDKFYAAATLDYKKRMQSFRSKCLDLLYL